MSDAKGDVARLPKWAQEHIRNLEREREAAVNALNLVIDDQTPAAMYVEDWACTGESAGPTTKRRYVQGRTLEIRHDGVALSITLRDGVIDLQWCQVKRGSGGDVCFQPRSYQQAYLIAKENMR